MRYGYARVSTIDQDLSIQNTALTAAGCELVRAEKVSGTSRAGRDELELLMQFMREGDELVVTRIDRLARRALEQPIDTSTAAGKCFLDMLGVFAEFETNLRKERQLEGIAKAKAAGVYKGRKPSIPVDEVKALRAAGKGATEIAEELGIARKSVYRALERQANAKAACRPDGP